ARQRREAAPPEGAVVNARLALDPQLHRIGPQPIAAPVGGPRDVGAHAVSGDGAAGRGHAEALRRAAHGLEERRAGGDRLALLARPGAHATLPGAGSEVGIAVGGGRRHDLALDARLAVQRVPVHDSRGERYFLTLTTFA